MTREEIAREHVIAAALRVVAGRTYRDATAPNSYDDAHAELDMDILVDHLGVWKRVAE